MRSPVVIYAFFMDVNLRLGPLAVEAKVRNQPRKVARLVKNREDLQKPQQVGSYPRQRRFESVLTHQEQLKENDFEKQQNETTALVYKIAKRLQEVGYISFFKFIVNPESFSQTVENLFYLSFLIRDGKVQAAEGEDGELMLGKSTRSKRVNQQLPSNML